MTLTELRYIVAVARELHFGRAAAACFVSQPTLSVAIKKLEDELDVTIFERRPHDVSITPVGQRIVEQALTVLEQVNAIRAIAGSEQNQLAGSLKLGVIYTIGPFLLPHFIPILNREAPDLTLIIEEDFTLNLAQQLKRGELDLIIISTPFEQPGATLEVLYQEPFTVMLPKNHRLSRKKLIRADDLIEDTLLLLKSGNCFRDQVMDVCPACKSDTFTRDKIQKTLEGSSIETIKQMVAAGSGVTILPSTAVREQDGLEPLVDYRPFAKPAPERDIALAWRDTWPRKQLIQLVSRIIRQCDIPGKQEQAQGTASI